MVALCMFATRSGVFGKHVMSVVQTVRVSGANSNNVENTGQQANLVRVDNIQVM